MRPTGQFDNHYAFLVGIDEYNDFPNLRGAHSDATTLRDALLWVGYPENNISLVSPAKTVLGDLKREIDEFLCKVSYKNSNPDILIFWAGHGVPAVHGGFLITRNTMIDSDNWSDSAIRLGWLAKKFSDISPASLAMFFDVCHSVPPRRAGLERPPRELILDSMREAVLRDVVRTTFVGVSTFAYEVWSRAREGPGGTTGILADALRRAMCGEKCNNRDNERCHDDDFAVTDKRLVHKLEAVIDRIAEEVGVHERLFVRSR